MEWSRILCALAAARLGLTALGAPVVLPTGRPYHVPCRVNVPEPSPQRQTVSLDGEWDFAIDAADQGVTEHWFDPARRQALDRRLVVPGCWDVQGVGQPTPKVHHNYVGPAWYRRTLRVPEAWAGRRCWLKIGGAHRYADVWVNSTYVGHHDTYVTAFQFDVTDLVRPGQDAVIAIRVDNRPAYPHDMTGCFSWFVNWGGLFRSVELEATAESYLADVFLRPDALTRTLAATVEAVGAQATAVALTVADRSARAALADGRAHVALPLPEAALWTPETPVLHLARVELLEAGGTVLDSWCERVGLRSLDLHEGDIRLNGQPVFLRGYGDDCIQPLTIHTPVEREVHRQHLQKTKAYGFIYVRHHSWTPPPEYFDVADELGFLIQPELPVAYEPWFLPNVEKLERQLREVVLQYRNHPSLAIYCMGNEFQVTGVVGQHLDRLVARARELDPTRLVRHTDPGPICGPGQGTCTGILHEYANVCVYPDVRARTKFGPDGYLPVRCQQAAASAAAAGLEPLLPRFAANSVRLQAILTRIYLENARARAPDVDGYNYWLITDCADEASTGLFDEFWDDRGVWTAEDFRQINGPTVLLLRADRPVYHGSSNWARTEPLDLRLHLGHAWPSTFRAGAPADLEVLLSDYSGTPFGKARLDWRIAAADGQELASGQADELPATECFRTLSLGRLRLDLPAVSSATAATLSLRLCAGEREANTQYRTWLFPGTGLLTSSPRPVQLVGDGPLATALRQRYPFLAAGDEQAPVRVRVGDPDAVDVEFAAGGGSLLVLGRHCFASEQAVFGTAWWQGGNNRGTVIRDHPALAGFPHDGFADLQLQRLLDGGRVMILSGSPVPVDPIIRGIDTPELGRLQAYLLELPVGDRGGRMLVTTLNFGDTCDTPEGAWLLDRLLRDATATRPADGAVGSQVATWLRPALDRLQVSQTTRASEPDGATDASPGVLLPGRAGALIVDLCYDGALPVEVTVEHQFPPELLDGGASRRTVRLLPGVAARVSWPVVPPGPGQWSVGPARVRLGDAVREVPAAVVRARFPRVPQNASFELVAGIAPSRTTRLVAAYEFAEGEGRTLHDAVGTNHGLIQGNAQWGAGPAAGRHALEFDGRSAGVTIPDAADLDLDSGFVVEAVFRPDPAAGTAGPACLVDKGGSALRNYGLYLVAGAELSAATHRDGSEFLETTRDLRLAAGVWHTAVWACDRSNGWLHVDGRLRGDWVVANGARLDPNDIPLFLGKRGPQNDMFLHGALARVAVARVDGAPTLAPLGWLSGTDGGCAWVDRGAKASGGASLRLEPAGGRTSVRAALPVRVRPGYTYAVGAALAVTPDYDRQAGLPAVVFRAGDAEQRVCLTSDVEPGQFAALTQTLTVPDGVEELSVEIEAFGGRGAAWVDDVCLSPEPQWEALARGRTPPGTVVPGVEWREAELPDGTNGEPAPVPRRVLEGEAAGGAAVCLDLPDSRWAGLWWRFEVRPQTAYAVWVRYRTEAPAAGFDDLFVCDSAGQPLPGTGRMRIPIDSGGVGYRWFRAGFLTGELSEVRVYLENEWNAIAATPSALWDALVLEEQD